VLFFAFFAAWREIYYICSEYLYELFLFFIRVIPSARQDGFAGLEAKESPGFNYQ
jgi:hypothetical protein